MHSVTRQDEKAVDPLRAHKPSQVTTVGSVLVCRDTSFFERTAEGLNYSYMFVEQYELPCLNSKTADIVRDITSSKLLRRGGTMMYRWCCAFRSPTESPFLLYVMKELNQRCALSQRLGVTALDEVVLVELVAETV